MSRRQRDTTMNEEKKYSSIVSQPEDGIIDVPHTPESEAALIQEVRERLSMLQTHLADPTHIGALKKMNNDLESLVQNMKATEEYDCDCTTRHKSIRGKDDNVE